MGVLNRLQPLALFALRLVLGVIMVAHGWQKIHAGPSHFASRVSAMGMPGWMGYLSVAAEFVGGLLVIGGFATRIASLFILVDMIVAIWKVHLHHGFFNQNGGYEFPLTLATVAFALIFLGAGELSIDALLGRGGGGKK